MMTYAVLTIAIGITLLSIAGCADRNKSWWESTTKDPNLMPESPCACAQIDVKTPGAAAWRARLSSLDPPAIPQAKVV